MTLKQQDDLDRASGYPGRFLRKSAPVPGHVCPTPHPDQVEPRDVWLCECRRMYVWSAADGYGFGWRRVFVRYWYFRATGGGDR